MPDVVGQPAARSVAELRKLGLKPNSVPEPVTDPSQAGLVIAQDPSAGEFVPANTRIRIEIGDHSLFDAREYAAPSEPAPEFEYLIPPIPSPLELLGASDEPTLWVSDDEMPEHLGISPPIPEPTEAEFEARWDGLGAPRAPDILDDTVVQEPSFHPDTNDTAAPPWHQNDPFESSPYKPRWTRKQRNRVLLAIGLLLLLGCLALIARHSSASHPKSAAYRPVPRVRVVTVTVTVTTPATILVARSPDSAPSATANRSPDADSAAVHDPP